MLTFIALCHACFVFAFDLSSHSVVFGQLYFVNTPAVSRELSACFWKSLQQHLSVYPFKQSIYGSAAENASYLFRNASPNLADKQESYSSSHSFLKCKMCEIVTHTIWSPERTRCNPFPWYEECLRNSVENVQLLYFFTTFFLFVPILTFGLLATGHLLKEQMQTYFCPPPSGKRCVHIVTVDHFLGKWQSQCGTADNLRFCI